MVNRWWLVVLFSLVVASHVTAEMSKWMTEGAPSDGSPPWGTRTVADSDPTKDAPNTDVTRIYELHISRAILAPDGVDQSMIVINGQFPGPVLEANWGDWFEVTVYNDFDEGSSIHWHGLNQKGTPFYDGVPFTVQCPIAPGTSLTYRFRADEYGTSWYHTHFSAQYTAGALGAIVIHGPNHVDYDIEVDPILVQDWYHESYEELVAQVTQPHVTDVNVLRPKAVANLIDGKGIFPCANITNGAKCTGGGYGSMDMIPGKKYRFRFVNTGTISFEQISIDGHKMTVIANDFVPVQPYETDVLTLGVGQRSDVIVTATGNEGDSFWLRAWNNEVCSDNISPDGRFILYYPNADKSVPPPENPTTLPANLLCANDDLAEVVPVYALPVKDPDFTLYVTATIQPNASGSFLWNLNGVSFQPDFNDPILLDAVKGESSWAPARQVYNLGSNSTLRLVFINTFVAPHAMHLHGHDFQILAEGPGTWDGSIVNPQNPNRRDVHMSRAGANATDPSIGPNYMVLQFELDNPGVWLFHCHLAWHLSGGMNIIFLEEPHSLYNMSIPQEVQDTCLSWSAWQATHGTSGGGGAKLMAKRRSKVDMAMSDEAWLKGRVEQSFEA